MKTKLVTLTLTLNDGMKAENWDHTVRNVWHGKGTKKWWERLEADEKIISTIIRSVKGSRMVDLKLTIIENLIFYGIGQVHEEEICMRGVVIGKKKVSSSLILMGMVTDL